MHLLLPILVLLLTPLVMLLLRLARPGFAYHWPVAALGALLAWPLVLVLRPGEPKSLALGAWQPTNYFPNSPAILVDEVSWPYGLAVVTLVLAVILTVVARQQPVNWQAWAGSLTLGGLGLMAVWAGNPLTLLLAWAGLDLAELLILLLQINLSAARERVVIAFTARATGMAFLLAAMMVSQANGTVLTFTTIPPQASLFLLLAAGLRLGVLPLQMPFLQELPMRRGLGTSLRLIPAAASLVLLSRAAEAGAPVVFVPYLLALTATAALVSCGAFAAASDELSGRPLWILGTAALAVAAAVEARPEAAAAWGLACVLPGGLLFLYSARNRNLLPLVAIGLLSFSVLPFTPGWAGAALYTSPTPRPLIPLFFAAHALLLVGYTRHALRTVPPIAGVERWVWIVYPVGLGLLPLAHFLIQIPGFLGKPGISGLLQNWWQGAIVLGLAGLFWVLIRRGPRLPRNLGAIGERLFSLAWFYRLLWMIYQVLGRLMAFFTLLLEGDGGILWTLVLLALLFSLLLRPT